MIKLINSRIFSTSRLVSRYCHCGPSTPSERFASCRLVPELLNKAPCEALLVTYKKICVNFGNEITPADCKDEPCVRWCPDPCKLYTLIMVDPDAPCRLVPSLKSWLHWMVVNIPCGLIEKGSTIAQYVGPAPPRNSGHHRYVFLLYQQCNEINIIEKPISNCCVEGRPKFNLQKFMEKHNLGDPEAGNFFVAEWECYVEIVNRQLGIK